MGKYCKFNFNYKRNEHQKAVLLGTEEKDIIEATPEDRNWGIGFNSEEAEEMVEEWGCIRLGKALMKVRTRPRQENEKGRRVGAKIRRHLG